MEVLENVIYLRMDVRSYPAAAIYLSRHIEYCIWMVSDSYIC